MTDTLAPTEPHPAAEIARRIVNDTPITATQLEAVASCALSGNRLAQVCWGTMERIRKGEPVSDRYLMGLALFLMELGES